MVASVRKKLIGPASNQNIADSLDADHVKFIMQLFLKLKMARTFKKKMT